MLFANREDAARQLSQYIEIDNPSNTLVVALPRGGVPLGLVISQEHDLPFDVIHAKKIGHPFHPEFAVGAIAEEGQPIWSEAVPGDMEEAVENVRSEIQRRRELYSKFLEEKEVRGRDVIIVDDGIATGMTMFAAIDALKDRGARSVKLAVPVIPSDTYDKLKSRVDDIFYVEVPTQFIGAVGAYYRDFSQVSDEEIQNMLE